MQEERLEEKIVNAIAFMTGQTKANEGPEAAVKFVGFIIAQLAGLTANRYGVAAAERVLVEASTCARASVRPESPGAVH